MLGGKTRCKGRQPCWLGREKGKRGKKKGEKGRLPRYQIDRLQKIIDDILFRPGVKRLFVGLSSSIRPEQREKREGGEEGG